MPNFDFSFYDNFTLYDLHKKPPVADGFNENIRCCLSDIKNSHIALGLALHALFDSRSYGAFCFSTCYDISTTRFFCYCFTHFSLDKSQVSRHMNVVYRFCHKKPELLPEFAGRSFSFLCELLPYTDEQINELLFRCVTVSDVRAYAKAHFSPAKSKPDSKKDKNITSVATSQQPKKQTSNSDEYEIFLSEPVSIPFSKPFHDYTCFDKFRGLTLQQILLNYIALEKNYTELSRSISITNS